MYVKAMSAKQIYWKTEMQLMRNMSICLGVQSATMHGVHCNSDISQAIRNGLLNEYYLKQLSKIRQDSEQ